MLEYHISTGTLLRKDTAGVEFMGTGYSGAGKLLTDGRNNPLMTNVPEKGPIPCGEYEIGVAYKSEHLGPCVMNLMPMNHTNTYGRSLFRIHGDNARNDASHGCIILGPTIRKAIALSGEKYLTVTQ